MGIGPLDGLLERASRRATTFMFSPREEISGGTVNVSVRPAATVPIRMGWFPDNTA